MLSISCNENEFSNADTLSKLSEGTLSVEEVSELEATEEEIEDVAIQMEEESDMDAIEDVEMVEDVMPVAGKEEELKICKQDIKKNYKRNKKRKYKKVKVELTEQDLAELSALKKEAMAIYAGLRKAYNGKKELSEEDIADIKAKKDEISALSGKANAIHLVAKNRIKEVVAVNTNVKNSDESEAKCAKKKKYKKYQCKSKRHLKRAIARVKVMICHVPRGNEANAVTLILPMAALKAHVKANSTNGSIGYMGPCKKDIQ